MTGINGHFGLFGNNGDRKIGINAQNPKTNEVKKEDVPVVEKKQVESKELGDELLTASTFYPGVNFSKTKAKAVEPGSLEDLTQTVTGLNLSQVTNLDKKAAFNMAPDLLTKAYTYGNINSGTTNILSSLNGESLPEFMLDDLLADVEIA